jgi:kynurenine formamidase
VEVVDLTHPLDAKTPAIRLPAPFAGTPGLKAHEISRYDERGPDWAWRWLEIGEHVGTHLDAPVHWVTGRDGPDVSQIPIRHLLAPAVVVNKSAECQKKPDYLLTVEDVRAFEEVHGPLPEGGWLLFRSGWEARIHDGAAHPRAPGFDAGCARWLAEESPLVGVGVETVSIDAGAAGGFDPAYPAHHYLLGAGKYGIEQLANLRALPPVGALLVVAPLKLAGGTGSPARVFAIVPRDLSPRTLPADRVDEPEERRI